MRRYPGTSPVALTLTGATNRRPNRSPDKARCSAIRESSPVALTLTGATDRIPNRSPDKAPCAAIREPSPVALTLTGATNRLPNRSPDKELCSAIREPPRWRLRLPGLPTEYRTVARIRRYAPLSGNPPPVALTLTGATNRIPNRSPEKALCAFSRYSPR